MQAEGMSNDHHDQVIAYKLEILTLSPLGLAWQLQLWWGYLYSCPFDYQYQFLFSSLLARRGARHLPVSSKKNLAASRQSACILAERSLSDVSF